MDYSRKKVLFVTGSLTDGGAERVMAILASQCAEMGADVSLVVLREKKQVYQISEKVNCYQIKINSRRLKIFSRIMQLHKIIKECNAEVLIPFLPIVTLYTMIANIGIEKKIIMSERADPNISLFAPNFSLKDRIGHLLMRKIGLFKRADWMVFQTSEAQAYYGSKLQKKSSIIPNPLDTDKLPNRFEGERDKRIVAVGRFSEEKNFLMLLNGFAIFIKKFPGYKLEIYGDGNQRTQLEKKCEELGIQEYVSMPGFVNNLTEKIVNASMYISTSNHEGISNSMIEALGMGIPTIVTDCPVGGARMFVRTDENGILIPMNNVNMLIDAMGKIASDAEYSEKISVNATEIREQLSAQSICEQWLALV